MPGYKPPHPTKTIVTLDKLKAGAKTLGISFGKITLQGLETKIKQELAKDRTYGCYACEACGNDIVDRIPVCPFCAAEFIPVGGELYDPDPDEAEVPLADEEEEDAVIDEAERIVAELEREQAEQTKQQAPTPPVPPTPATPPNPPSSEGAPDRSVPAAKPRKSMLKVQAAKQQQSAVDHDRIREVLEDSAQQAKKKKKKKKKGRPSLKEQDLERRRAQIRQELPYTREQLAEMKRTTLVMIAGILGLHNPVRLGSIENMAEAIMIKQREEYPSL